MQIAPRLFVVICRIIEQKIVSLIGILCNKLYEEGRDKAVGKSKIWSTRASNLIFTVKVKKMQCSDKMKIKLLKMLDAGIHNLYLKLRNRLDKYAF